MTRRMKPLSDWPPIISGLLAAVVVWIARYPG